MKKKIIFTFGISLFAFNVFAQSQLIDDNKKEIKTSASSVLDKNDNEISGQQVEPLTSKKETSTTEQKIDIIAPSEDSKSHSSKKNPK